MSTSNLFRDKHEIADFSEAFLEFTPYKYQENFLMACAENKRVTALWPRQSGKSSTVAVLCLYKALTTKEFSIIIVAPTQSQSSELYAKIRKLAESSEYVRGYIKSATQTEITLKNHSRILALPTGPEGVTIRGYTADLIIIEEAGYIKDSIVNEVIIPMIAAKPHGQIIKIGTPKGKNHFYLSCYGKETNYKLFHITWRDVVKEGQYSKEFINEQRSNLSNIEFQTEYEAQFIEDTDAYFKQELLDSCVEEYPMIHNIY